MAESIQPTYVYNDFDRNSYFTVCFNKLASTLFFQTPLEENKENMEAALGTVDPNSREFEVLFKNWNTEEAKNADFSKDFAYQYFLRSKSKKLLVWLALEYEALRVDFFYDSADLDAEQWVIATNHQLRRKFGLNRTPVFRVMQRQRQLLYGRGADRRI